MKAYLKKTETGHFHLNMDKETNSIEVEIPDRHYNWSAARHLCDTMKNKRWETVSWPAEDLLPYFLLLE